MRLNTWAKRRLMPIQLPKSTQSHMYRVYHLYTIFALWNVTSCGGFRITLNWPALFYLWLSSCWVIVMVFGHHHITKRSQNLEKPRLDLHRPWDFKPRMLWGLFLIKQNKLPRLNIELKTLETLFKQYFGLADWQRLAMYEGVSKSFRAESITK